MEWVAVDNFEAKRAWSCVGVLGVRSRSLFAARCSGASGIIQVRGREGRGVVGVVRVPVVGGWCWLCRQPAVVGERLPGRGRRVRLLYERHEELTYGRAVPSATAKAQQDGLR